MYARIVNGKVFELSNVPFTLGDDECAHCVEVGEEVSEGWLWTPGGCIAPTEPAPDPVASAHSYLLADAQTVQELREAVANVLGL